MGMTYEQYWDGDAWAAKAYRKAYYIKREYNNFESWLIGAYVYDAVGKNLQNAFAKKGAKKAEYIKQPFNVTPKSDDQVLREAKKEREKLVAALDAWVARTGR